MPRLRLLVFVYLSMMSVAELFQHSNNLLHNERQQGSCNNCTKQIKPWKYLQSLEYNYHIKMCSLSSVAVIAQRISSVGNDSQCLTCYCFHSLLQRDIVGDGSIVGNGSLVPFGKFWLCSRLCCLLSIQAYVILDAMKNKNCQLLTSVSF